MNHKTIWSGCSTFLTLLLILVQPDASSSANILALFPFSSRSHNNVYSTITKALAQKGHHLTVLTSFPLDSPPPNYKQINTFKEVEKHLSGFNTTQKKSPIALLGNLNSLTEDVCGRTFSKPEVKKLINPTTEKFDLILISNFFSECFYAFSHVYKAPMVLISPSGPFPTTDKAVGNVVLPSFNPNPILAYTSKMTFTERIVNTLTTFVFTIFYSYVIEANMERKMKEAFGENTPSLDELEKGISLILMNHHFSLNGARPLVPNLVEVGGLHVKPPKELPEDLKKFLDEAGTNGVIYFSLGSVLRSANFPPETRDAFIEAFSQIKQKVLWKWEGDPIPGKPENVRLEKWLPQQDLLAHSNVKLFITHGGLLSFQEAMTRGVPLAGIPYFGDQDANLNKIVNLKIGVRLDPNNLTTVNILNAINTVLGDPSYATNMKKLHSVVADQLEHPLDRAIYWIEYVLRHNGARHLRTAAADMPWYQIYMLDVLAVIVILPMLVLFVIIFIIIKLVKRKCQGKTKSKDTKKKKQ